MIKIYRTLYGLLTKRQRIQGAVLLMLILLMSFLQMAGVASVLPFMAVAANPEALNQHQYLSDIYKALNFSGLRPFLLVLGSAVFLMVLLSTLVKGLTTYLSVRFSEMRKYDFSRALLAGYLSQPYEWHLTRNSAELGKSILSETEQVVSGALKPAIQLISELAVTVAIVALLVFVDPMLALFLATGIGGTYAVIYFAMRRSLARAGRDWTEANRERFTVIGQIFGSIKDVKASGIEKQLLDSFKDPAFRYARGHAWLALASQLPRFVLEALAFGGILGVVIFLVANDGGLSSAIPVLSVYAFGAYRLMPAVQSIFAQVVSLRFSKRVLDNFHADYSSMNYLSRVPVGTESQVSIEVKRSINLSNVSYVYPSAGRQAVRDITLSIPAGQVVGLVGPTGSGKTTVLDLILGLLEPSAGQVDIDGRLIDSKSRRGWQASIGYVPQSIFLIEGSIEANIAFGVPKERIDVKKVEEVAKIAQIYDFIIRDLSSGFFENVGERGVRLSGGQRQRIGIARALYRNPSLLVLDEATSALDNLTEQAVMQAIRQAAKNKTVVMVAHRMSTIKHCDLIYLVKGGQICASGRYDELAKQCADFADMHDSEQ